MKRLVAESILWLAVVDLLIWRNRLDLLFKIVGQQRVCARNESTRPNHSSIVQAFDLACVFYLKKSKCLQRSAAVTILLRRYGWHAEMVIGAQLVPFKKHAWVEIDRTVVNDKPYILEMYEVLDRIGIGASI